MKQAQFFEAVKFTRAGIVAVQDGTKGFKLVARVNHTDADGESETQEMVLTTTVGDETRYFKAVAALPLVLREHKIFSFGVELEDVEVKKGKRKVVKPAAAPTAPARKTAKGSQEAATA